ncbi:MAG: N-acetylmuramoyl-L-alanine amidase [Clostridia bacterium]|nr:N-acetylmuramoyl-L-alanine amidase [Clostridia bacterium]
MLFVIRKTHIFLSCAVVVIFVLSLGIYNYADNKPLPQTNNNLLIIDAGHGGMDGGAVGTNGTLEKEINLKVSIYLKEIAEKNGKKVIMTREEDTSLHTTDSSKVRDQKRSDLENRRQILLNNNTGIFISIHMNKYETEDVKGAQVFYANNDQSRTLANKIQNSLIKGLADGNKRVAKPAPSSLYIFKGCNSTAVVVECGFLSCPEEEKLLATEEYQKKLAQCIYDGVYN